MVSPGIDIIKGSTDAFFAAATANPRLGRVKVHKTASDGSTLEGMFVPFELAVRGFAEMSDFEDPYLGLRRIKRGDEVVRHIIELSLGVPYDKSRGEGSGMGTQSIVDYNRLFTRNTFRRFCGLESLLRDISRPLEPGPNLFLAAEARIENLARKMSQASGAVAERAPV